MWFDSLPDRFEIQIVNSHETSFLETALGYKSKQDSTVATVCHQMSKLEI